MKNLIAISAKKRCGKDTAAIMIIDAMGSRAPGYPVAVSYALAKPIKEALMHGLNSCHQPVIIKGERVFRRWTMDDMNGLSDLDREEDLLMDCNDAHVILKSAWSYIELRKPELKKFHTQAWNLIEDFTMCDTPHMVWSVRTLMQTFGTDVGVNTDKIIWMRFLADVYIEAIRDNITLIVTDCRQDHEMEIMRRMGALVMHIDRPGYSDVVIDNHVTEKGLNREPGDIILSNDDTLESFKQKVLTSVGIK